MIILLLQVRCRSQMSLILQTSIQKIFLLENNMILIKGSIAVGSDEGMKFLTKFAPGGYPVLSFENWDALCEWGKNKEKELLNSN